MLCGSWPHSPSTAKWLVEDLTLNVLFMDLKNTPSAELVHVLRWHQISLPYVNTGEIRASYMWNITVGERYLNFRSLCFRPKQALLPLSLKYSWEWLNISPFCFCIEWIAFSRYLYDRTTLTALPLYVSVTSFAFPKSIGLYLRLFTIIRLFSQKRCSPLSCRCRPFWLSENNTRSSAHSRWGMIKSPAHTACS